MKHLKILFLESHPMWIHGLPNGFRDLGHEVVVSGPLTETNIPALLSAFQPDLVAMMGWTDEHSFLKLTWVYEYVKPTGIPFIYWATEDPTHTFTFTLPVIKTIRPDFVFTICPEKVDYYKQIGFKAAHLDFGYHPSVHHHVDPQERYHYSIAVVANAYPQILTMHKNHFRNTSLKNLLQPLIKRNIRVDFWGKQWEYMYPILGCVIPAGWLHGYIHYTEAHKIYSSADIVIGFQNLTTQLTQRTYEILGSEGFLLTANTQEICRLFKPGEDLVVSSSPEETLELVQYYLNHPDEREKIRKQGGEHAKEYTYKHRAQQVIDTLKQHGILDDRIIQA
jgi:spore maturation protein CgeB